MPSFVCVKCGHWANTAYSYWAISGGKDQRCHRCILEEASDEELLYIKWMNIPRFPKASTIKPRGIIS